MGRHFTGLIDSSQQNFTMPIRPYGRSRMAAKLKGISRLKNLKSMTMNILMNSGNLWVLQRKLNFWSRMYFHAVVKTLPPFNRENISKRSMIMSTDNLLAELTSKQAWQKRNLIGRHWLSVWWHCATRMLLPVIWWARHLRGHTQIVLINYLPVVITHQTVCWCPCVSYFTGWVSMKGLMAK